MRSLVLACTGAIGLLACSFNSTGITATGVTVGTSDTTGGATTTTPTTGDPTPTGDGTGGACTPGQSAACTCDGAPGEMTCEPDGEGYGPCDCEDVTTTLPSTTAVDPDTSGTSSTTAVDPSTTTTGEPGSSSTTAVDPSTTTSDDTTTTVDTTTSDDTTGDPACMQIDEEPNGDEASALDGTDQTCKVAAKQIAGTLDGSGGVDWWKYDADYNNGCGGAGSHPNPTHTLTADPAVRMCVYFRCKINDADADLTCPNGTTDDTSPGGHPGCCTTEGALAFELNCVGVEDDAEVFIRLDMAPANACVDYSVSYTYND
jgi:hypothetical protein